MEKQNNKKSQSSTKTVVQKDVFGKPVYDSHGLIQIGETPSFTLYSPNLSAVERTYSSKNTTAPTSPNNFNQSAYSLINQTDGERFAKEKGYDLDSATTFKPGGGDPLEYKASGRGNYSYRKIGSNTWIPAKNEKANAAIGNLISGNMPKSQENNKETPELQPTEEGIFSKVFKGVSNDIRSLNPISIGSKILTAAELKKERMLHPHKTDFTGENVGKDKIISYTGVNQSNPKTLQEAKNISNSPSVIGSLLSKVLPLQVSSVLGTVAGGLPITQSNLTDSELREMGNQIYESSKSKNDSIVGLGYEKDSKGKRVINVGNTTGGIFSKDPKVTTGLTFGKSKALKDKKTGNWYVTDSQDADEVSKKSI